MADPRQHVTDQFANPFASKTNAPSMPTFGMRQPELLGDFYAGNRKQLEKLRSPAAAVPRRGRPLRVFVGGALDNLYGQNMKSYYDRYLDAADGPAEYYTHLSVPSIVGAIKRANDQGIPVDVIGHSYGGTAAFNAVVQAGQRGYRVRRLITVDPVGRLSMSDGPPVSGSVSTWTNISANPLSANLSDIVAAIGGKPSSVPTAYADEDFTVRRHHQDLAGMMRDADIDIASSAGADFALSDDLDGREWSRRRNAQLRGETWHVISR